MDFKEYGYISIEEAVEQLCVACMAQGMLGPSHIVFSDEDLRRLSDILLHSNNVRGIPNQENSNPPTKAPVIDCYHASGAVSFTILDDLVNKNTISNTGAV